MFTENNQKKIVQTAGLVGVAAAVLMLTQTFTTLKEMRYIGRGSVVPPTISVSGEGKVYTKPDVAIITVGVTKNELKQVDASTKVTEATNKIRAALKDNGIDLDKDVKTTNRSLNPRYEWKTDVCPRTINYAPCPGKNVLVGFEVSESLEIKVRALDNAGKIVDAITAAGATDINGPTFTLDDKKAVEAEAREIAIKDAKQKAEKLASDLGVHVTRIASFNENTGGGHYFAPRAMMMKAEMMDGAGAAPATEILTGQSEINSNVTITFEIK